MKNIKDSWCSPLTLNGKVISGSAAREIRIKRAGGLEKLISTVANNLFIELSKPESTLTQSDNVIEFKKRA